MVAVAVKNRNTCPEMINARGAAQVRIYKSFAGRVRYRRTSVCIFIIKTPVYYFQRELLIYFLQTSTRRGRVMCFFSSKNDSRNLGNSVFTRPFEHVLTELTARSLIYELSRTTELHWTSRGRTRPLDFNGESVCFMTMITSMCDSPKSVNFHVTGLV